MYLDVVHTGIILQKLVRGADSCNTDMGLGEISDFVLDKSNKNGIGVGVGGLLKMRFDEARRLYQGIP